METESCPIQEAALKIAYAIKGKSTDEIDSIKYGCLGRGCGMSNLCKVWSG